jgi:hypothetical protein
VLTLILTLYGIAATFELLGIYWAAGQTLKTDTDETPYWSGPETNWQHSRPMVMLGVGVLIGIAGNVVSALR